MTTFQFHTHVSDSGVVTLPLEFCGRRVVISVDKDFKKKRKACAEDVQKFMDTCYGCLEGLSDGEFERLKMERIMEE